MCDKALLVAYLYEDLSVQDRAAFDAHLRGCPACRAELHALRDVRVDLSTWAPPLPDFGFRVVQGAETRPAKPVLTSPRWTSRWMPAFGLAAAATLVLAAATAIAHPEIRYGSDGFSIRTGWNTAPVVASAPVPAARTVAAPAAPAVDPAVLKAIEFRLRALETAPRDTGVQKASVSRESDAALIKQFKDLLAQSETKQRGELALRMSQMIHDVDAQRIADLTRIQQGMGRIDAMATQEQAAHRELANYITSQKQK